MTKFILCHRRIAKSPTYKSCVLRRCFFTTFLVLNADIWERIIARSWNLTLDTHTHTHTGPNAANDMHSPSAQLKNDTNPQTLKQTQACWTPKNRTLTSGALPCDSEDASFFGGCLSHCQKLLPSEMVSVIQPMALCVLPRVATLPRVACGKGKTITWTLHNLILSLTTEHTLCLFMPSFFHGTLKKALCNLRMLPTWAKNKKS